MASNWTNRGRYNALNVLFRGASAPASFYLVLCTATTTPTVDTNVMSELSEIAAGNGYTAGGYQVQRNATDFDVLTEDDTNDYALTQLKDIIWNASGGAIPSSGSARWLVLTDANATFNSREVWMWWDLGSTVTVSSGQPLKMENTEIRFA